MNPAPSTELLAPAGDFETALAAFDAGADAVYCALAAFSARAFAKNLTPEELGDLMRVARARGRKVYVAFNTLVAEDELPDAAEKLAFLDSAGVDAIIVQDLGIAKLARENFPRLALHASTQLAVHNLEGVLALKDLGFARTVLARELTLEEIASISKKCAGMELECFIHGALCYSISGLCLFSAMENARSGNRGKCAYCCRMPNDGAFPFSMRDLRLGDDARRLAAAGVASLKIEGRMKSPLYVASAVKRYREILDGTQPTVTDADLETVFSRRTTKLYLDGRNGGEDVLDSASLGHVGTKIGEVKRVTGDREGRKWLRFHTARALERHDGIQIVAPDGAKKCGFGIGTMRRAISRSPVFEAEAGADVEILLSDGQAAEISPGDIVCCSMSNAMKRRFPVPSFRPGDYPGIFPLDVELKISRSGITAIANGAEVSVAGDFAPSQNPSATREAARKAFSKLGGTGYCLRTLSLDDPEGLFVPPSILNAARREAVRIAAENAARGARAVAMPTPVREAPARPLRTFRRRSDQQSEPGDWDEEIVLVAPQDAGEETLAESKRLALPVFTSEKEFNRLRVMVKRYIRQGFRKWEASDLATLRMLKALGISDITADWTLYAVNSCAMALLHSLGVKRIVASPEFGAAIAARCDGIDVEYLSRQSTPLFISLNKPGEAPDRYVVARRGELWITARREPRTFEVPRGASSRLDISWDAPGADETT